jgi:cation/acetate symporter
VTQRDGSDAEAGRAAIDAGFSFALAAFTLGLGLLGVLARVGLPGSLLRFCVWAMIFAGLVVVTVHLRTMRPGEFYAGGRDLPPTYAALAYSGLAAGLFLAFLPPPPPGVSFAALAVGFAAGLTCALCLTGPYLRRSAAFSIADLVGCRFPHPLVRCAIALIAAGCAVCVALAGFDIALRAFIATTGSDRSLGIVIVGLLLVLLIVPAGLSGVIWLAVGATIVSLAALGLPAALSIFHDPSLWLDTTARLALLSGAQAAPPFSPVIAIAVALGLAALTPLFGPSVASGGRIPALRAGPLAVFFLGLLAVLSVLTLTRATRALDTVLVGQEPTQLPAEILTASRAQDLTLCGIASDNPPAIAAACAAQPGFKQSLRRQDIGASAAYLLENFPNLTHLGAVLAGLASVFTMTLGMAVAAAGIQSFATSLGHDIYHPDRRRFGPVSRRLAIARALTVLLIAGCGIFLAHHRADPRALILLAVIVSASLIAPVLILTLVKRATAFDAGAALAVAIAIMALFFFTHRQSWPMGALAGNAIFAALDAAFAGWFASLLHRRAPAPAGPALPPPGQLVGPD